MSVTERAIREQGVRGRVISERANFGASDQGVTKINNTVINE